MRKLSVLCVLMCICFYAFAEKGVIILKSPTEFQVLAVSPNGKWACGISGDGITSPEKGVLWNVETGEFTYLSTSGSSTAYDVADDGTVVGSGGYYKDGRWHSFDNSSIPGVGGGTVFSISRDARVAVGYVMQGGKYAPCKWEDGKLKLIYPYNNVTGQCYTVSDDGKYAAGWDYTTVGGATQNRTIALWTDTTVQYLSERASFAEAGRRFSPDNSKLVCEALGHKIVYDLNKKEKFELPFISFDCSNQIVCYVNNDGLVLGQEEMYDPLTGNSDIYGYVWTGEKAMKLVDWLKETHNVEIDQSKYLLYRGVEMSNDGKVITMLANVLEGGFPTGEIISIIVALDREIDICPPVTVSLEKLRGVNSVRVTWSEPLMNAENVLGYNIYRDGVMICEGLTDMAYIDAVPAEGTYSYTITALYEGENGNPIESEHSIAATINVVDEPVNKVRNIETHTYNYNDLKLRWATPESNLPSITYYDYNSSATGFGGGVVSFLAGIRMPHDMVANYADNHAIARVAFMPRNPEAIYSVKIFVDGILVVSQVVDNATLIYNNMNTIDLDTPVTFYKYSDVLVAIEADATNFTAASNDVIGMCYGNVVTGFSDLLRQKSEPEFYSLNQSSINAGYGEMPVCWAISAVLAEMEDGKPNVEIDMIEGYDVYRDEEKLATVVEPYYLDKGVADGMHTYGVAVRYADGSVAEQTTLNVRFTPRTAALKAINEVNVGANETSVEASWEAPLNNDETVISYSSDKSSGKGITIKGALGLVEYTVAHDYPYNYVEWYDGYNIESLRFYPTDEAVFVIALEVDGIDVAFIEIGEMGAEDGYTLNRWNIVELPEPVKIKMGSSYRVKLVCSEVDPSTYPICLDNGRTRSGVSDLYSFDYASFSSANADAGVSGNWMLGMVIANESTDLLPVDSYKVILDGDSNNADRVTETTYRKEGLNWNDGETHRIRVNAVYSVDGGTLEIEGTQQTFNVKSGVESIEVNRVTVYPNPATSYIKVDGYAEKLELIDMSGRVVAETDAAIIDVTALSVGNYLLNIYNNGNVSTVKVMIVR